MLDNLTVSSTQKIRVGVVEDHPLFLELLTNALSDSSQIEIVATAAGALEAKKWFKPEELDVLILDIELSDGNGIGLGITLRRKNPDVGIVLLSDKDVLELVLGLPEEDRRGWSYLTKSSTKSIDVLIQAIILSAQGQTVIDSSLTNRAQARPGTAISNLTNRQFEVLRSVARGESNQTIATNLGIAVNSVGNHLIAIYDTLGIPEGKNARVAAVLDFMQDTTRPANWTRTFGD